MQHIPNLISLLRILLVIPTALALWRDQYPQALILMSVAGVSDAVDGGLARRYGWTSELGRALDPIADKLLVGTMIVVFTLHGQLPLWVALIVVSRDFIILLGAAAYWHWFEKIGFTPTLLSKANTAMQIATLVLLLLALCDFGAISEWAAVVVDPYLFYVLALLAVASGTDYVVTWGRRALASSRRHPTIRQD